MEQEIELPITRLPVGGVPPPVIVCGDPDAGNAHRGRASTTPSLLSESGANTAPIVARWLGCRSRSVRTALARRAQPLPLKS
jgi:hypothetical protein